MWYNYYRIRTPGQKPITISNISIEIVFYPENDGGRIIRRRLFIYEEF